MNRKATITAAEALAWEERLGRDRPVQMNEDEASKAIEVTSFNVSGGGDGMYLRIKTRSGQADLFLNAPVAISLSDIIKQVGKAGVWMNEDDGSLIVLDPQNLNRPGRKI